MVQISTFLSYLAASASIVAAAPAAAPAATPAPTAAPDLEKRASCTFSGSTGAAAVSKSKASCATIVLSNVAVPSGTTLDLTKLTTGTHVIFEGTTTFGYEEVSKFSLSFLLLLARCILSFTESIYNTRAFCQIQVLIYCSGLALSSQSRVRISLSLGLQETSSTAMVLSGGMEREAMVARLSQSSSMPTP